MEKYHIKYNDEKCKIDIEISAFKPVIIYTSSYPLYYEMDHFITNLIDKNFIFIGKSKQKFIQNLFTQYFELL